MSHKEPLSQEPEEDQISSESEIFGGMLNDIMANYFEYEHSDGNTLNLAEVLLLIRQSIDHNTEVIKELTKSVQARSKS